MTSLPVESIYGLSARLISQMTSGTMMCIKDHPMRIPEKPDK
jgi:hypothetical protein